jgi:hypothetical protein
MGCHAAADWRAYHGRAAGGMFHDGFWIIPED